MTDYYVRKSGDNGNAGTSPGAAWLTIAKALQSGGMAAGDRLFIGAGVYRESITSGLTDFASMTVVHGDVTGERTGDAGEVVWSAWTTSDVAAPSAYNLDATATRNLQFENITFACGSNAAILHQEDADPYNLVFIKCAFVSGPQLQSRAASIEQTTAHACNVYFDRCRFFGAKVRHLWTGVASGADWDANIVIMGSFFLSGEPSDDGCITTATPSTNTFKAGGLKVVNNTIITAGQAVYVKASSTSVKAKIYGNFIFGFGAATAVLQSHSTSAQDEDYNAICAATARTNVTAGANSITGATKNLGLIDFGQYFGLGAQGKQIGELLTGNPAIGLGRSTLAGIVEDLFGGPAIGSGSENPSAGAMQLRNSAQREQSVFHSGSNALKIVGPGYQDFQTVVDASSTTLSVWARYNSDYDPVLTAVGTHYGRPTEIVGVHRAVAVHPSGRFAAVAHDTSPYLSVYTAHPDVPGLGRRLINPAALPAGDGKAVAWSPDGNYLAISHATSPYVTVYAFDQDHGIVGAKVSDPGTPPAGQGNGVRWSPDGSYIAVAHAASPYVSVYPWSGGAFGSKEADPASLPTSTGNSVDWTSTSDYLAVAHDTDPGVSVYPWSAGFGAKLSDPATKPANNGRCADFSPDDAYLAVSGNASPFIYAYPFTKTGGGSIGTKISDPGTLPGFSVKCIQFSPDGDYIALASGDTPFLLVYPWNAGAFGTKLTNPGTLPGNECNLAWLDGGSAILYPGGVSNYTVSYRMRSRLPAMQILNGEECGVAPQEASMTSTFDTWEELSVTFTPTSKGIVTVRISSRAKNSSGIAYFDDFSVS